jgi:hypothetical protein
MNKQPLSSKTIREAARETSVFYEADVVVVGGGPGGHSAAVAAARNGAKTILVERYGHLGGMASGGIVILIPSMSCSSGKPQMAGLSQEWLDRLAAVGGSIHPKKEELGSTDPKLVARWQRFLGCVNNGKIQLSASMDPELLKCVLNDMVAEAGIKLLLDSWGTEAIVDNNTVKGIIFESKSGRKAVLGKVIIDGTGDGDLLPSAGAEFDATMDPKLRNSMLALVFRIGDCDYQKLCDFREAKPKEYHELMSELSKVAGTQLMAFPSARNDVMWVNNWIQGLNCLNVEDLTKVEVEMRRIMLKAHAFMKNNIPTFENSFILDTASQIGTRGSRRLTGEYVVTIDDLKNGKKFDDTIAIIPHYGPPEAASAHMYIPYRSMVPARVDGLLVAGRSFSSDVKANERVNLIPHCIVMGEAAGTAAALAVKNKVEPRKVNYRQLQESLVKQGAILTPVG